MWSVPRQREDSEPRLDRLLAAFDSQIEEIEACSAANTPYWDGYCGLVKVCDEDLVRRDAAPRHAALAAAIQQHGEQQQRQQQLQHQGEQRHGKQQQAKGGQTAGSTAVSSSAQTPLTGSPRGSVGSTSPFKVAPAALPQHEQPAAVLTEQAAAALQQRRPHDAEALLHLALEKCATQDTQLATQVVDLLLSCEREWQQAPSDAGSGGGSEEATALLRSAVQALGDGQEQRAVTLLQRALAVCPRGGELRRRIALHLELVLCKRQQ